jgi:hypothetical protein
VLVCPVAVGGVEPVCAAGAASPGLRADFREKPSDPETPGDCGLALPRADGNTPSSPLLSRGNRSAFSVKWPASAGRGVVVAGAGAGGGLPFATGGVPADEAASGPVNQVPSGGRDLLLARSC